MKAEFIYSIILIFHYICYTSSIMTKFVSPSSASLKIILFHFNIALIYQISSHLAHYIVTVFLGCNLPTQYFSYLVIFFKTQFCVIIGYHLRVFLITGVYKNIYSVNIVYYSCIFSKYFLCLFPIAFLYLFSYRFISYAGKLR